MEQERRAKRETYMPYTSAEEHSLLQMKEAGKSWAEIKEAFPKKTKKALQSYWEVSRSRSMIIPVVVLYIPERHRARTGETIKKLWTPAEDGLLKKLRADGYSWPDIAKAFPTRTRDAVEMHYKILVRRTMSKMKCAAVLYIAEKAPSSSSHRSEEALYVTYRRYSRYGILTTSGEEALSTISDICKRHVRSSISTTSSTEEALQDNC